MTNQPCFPTTLFCLPGILVSSTVRIREVRAYWKRRYEFQKPAAATAGFSLPKARSPSSSILTLKLLNRPPMGATRSAGESNGDSGSWRHLVPKESRTTKYRQDSCGGAMLARLAFCRAATMTALRLARLVAAIRSRRAITSGWTEGRREAREACSGGGNSPAVSRSPRPISRSGKYAIRV